MRSLQGWHRASRALVARVAFVASLVAVTFSSWIAPPPARAQECPTCVECASRSFEARLTGTATRVGASRRGKDAGAQVSVLATFKFDGPINLGASKLTLASVLDEAGGAGELVSGVPVALPAHRGGRLNTGVFVSPSGTVPTIRAKIQGIGDDTYQLRLIVNRATISRFPELCSGHPRPTTDLVTNVVVTDPGSETRPASEFRLRIARPWRCLRLSQGDFRRPRALSTDPTLLRATTQTTTTTTPRSTATTSTTTTRPPVTVTTTTLAERLTLAQWEFYVRITTTAGDTNVLVPKRSTDAPVSASIRSDHIAAFPIDNQVTGAEIAALGGDTLARLTDAARAYVESRPADYPGFSAIVEIRWAKRVG